MEIYKQLSKF